MDEEYVQEHILTDGIVAPLEAPRRLIHGRLQPFRSALSRRTRHISSGLAVFVLLLRVVAAPKQCNALNHIATLLTKRTQQMIDGGLRSV
jgi:hypothetical protein